MKKTVLSVALAAAMIAGLAACSSTSSGANDTSGSAPGAAALKNAKGVTNITVWHGLGGPAGDAFTSAVADFNAANKGKIHVDATFQGVYADLLAKYTASLRSKNAPTLMVAGDVATGYMTDVKQSIPAAEMAKANPSGLKLDDLSAAGRNYYRVDGVQQAVPMNVSTPVLWVNKDLLKRAGITDMSSLSTLDGMTTAAKAVAEKTGEKGFTMPDDDWYLEQLTAHAGQPFCTADNGRKGSAATGITINKGAAKAAISKVVDLYTGGVAVDGATDGSAAISVFTGGKVGTMLFSSGALGTIKTVNGLNYEALPFPAASSDKNAGAIVGGSALWLSKTATKAQQVAGWKFETFMTSAKTQESFSHATGYVPINNDVAKSSTQQQFLQLSPATKVFIKQVADTPVNDVTAGCVTGTMTNIRTGNINQLQAALNGSKSPSAALDAAAASAKTALQQYREQLSE